MKIQAEFQWANLRKPRVAFPLICLIVIGSMGAVFATNILTQTFTHPNGTVPVVTGCATLSTTAIPIIGTSGNAVFKCGTSPAFTASAGTVTPTITGLPSGWSLAITADPAATCPGGTAITSGTAVTFGTTPPTGSYDYCESYTNYAPPSPALTVTWAQ